MKKYLPSILASSAIILAASAVLIRTKNFTDVALAAPATHVVISEVKITGGTGQTNNDFIELFNPTDSPFDLNGHRLVKRTATGSADQAVKSWTTETVIAPHGYYLWANGSWTPAVTPDTTTSATLAADNGVALRQGAEDTGVIIDSVAWGTVTNAFIEGSPFPEDPTGSLERKPCGEDTDNNADDFVLRETADPQNSQSPTEECLASPTATATASSTPTSSPTMTASPTATATSSPTSTPTSSPTSTSTPTASASPSMTAKPTHKPNAFSCRVEFTRLNFGFFTLKIPFLKCF